MTTIKSWLAAIITVGFLGALFVLFQIPLPESSKDILLVLIGCLTGIIKDVYGYYFGSSEGSARKTELLSPPVTDAKTPDSQAGFISLRLLLPLAFAALFLMSLWMLSGCASLQKDPPEVTAGKSLLAMKATIVTAATAGDELCRKGMLTREVCISLADYYHQAQPAYDLAADSLRLALLSKSPESWEQYVKRQTGFRAIFDDILRISSQHGLIGGDK